MQFVKILLGLILANLTVGLKISVYYESLCPDSVNFIGDQLYPNYGHLKDYIDLELVPFGKALHTFVGNKWHFRCQHGPPECRGNKYQSCALNQKNGKDKDVDFVNCVMRTRNPANLRGMKNCASKVNINWDNIHNCAISNKGDDLLANNGDKTLNLDPSISYVPTIIFNDKYDDYLQTMSLHSFASVVCSNLNGTKPEFCKNKELPEEY